MRNIYVNVVLFFIGFSVYAGHEITYKNEPCLSTETMAHRYKIVQKIDKRSYEAVSIFNPDLRLLIKTKKGFEFSNTGIVAKFNMRRVGVKTMKLSNGFDKGIQIYEQCDLNKQ